jgi:hypothetical protein
MKYTVFTTPDNLNLTAITTFGVSVKPYAHPIGQFGTGLKYAIAILLRTGHGITIQTSTERHTFSTIEQDFRNQEVSLVAICTTPIEYDENGLLWEPDPAPNPVPLAYTTQLGAHWKLWQAFRELESNTRDERGYTEILEECPSPRQGYTQIIITGEDFAEIAHDVDSYFLPDLYASKASTTIEVIPLEDIYSTDILFNKSVRIAQLPDKTFLNTYNILSKIPLTEDRTLAEAGWCTFRDELILLVLRSYDADFIRSFMTAPDHTYEYELPFSWYSHLFNPTFKKILEDIYSTEPESLIPNLSNHMISLREQEAEDLTPKRELTVTVTAMISENVHLTSFIDYISDRIEDKYPDSNPTFE